MLEIMTMLGAATLLSDSADLHVQNAFLPEELREPTLKMVLALDEAVAAYKEYLAAQGVDVSSIRVG